MAECARVVLGVIAKHTGAASVGDALDAVLARGFEDVARADDVRVQDRLPAPSRVQRRATPRVPAEVDNGIHPLRRLEHGIVVRKAPESGPSESVTGRACRGGELVTVRHRLLELLVISSCHSLDTYMI